MGSIETSEKVFIHPVIPFCKPRRLLNAKEGRLGLDRATCPPSRLKKIIFPEELAKNLHTEKAKTIDLFQKTGMGKR